MAPMPMQFGVCRMPILHTLSAHLVHDIVSQIMTLYFNV